MNTDTSQQKLNKLSFKMKNEVKYFSLIIASVQMDVIIWYQSYKWEDQFEEIRQYIDPKTCVIIEEGIEYWILTNKAVLARRRYNIKFSVEDREESA